MTEERREKIVDNVLDYLATTEAGLTPESAKKFREYIDLHANDTVRHFYGQDGDHLEEGEEISEAELKEIILEVVENF